MYPATEGLSFKVIGGIRTKLDTLLQQVTEYLPVQFLSRPGFRPLPDALRMLHRPPRLPKQHRAAAACVRGAFVRPHSATARKRYCEGEENGNPVREPRELTSSYARPCRSSLTQGRKRQWRRLSDMAATGECHRLLQGDVGAGRPIVALFACLLAMENGFQAAIMGHPELLAESISIAFASSRNPWHRAASTHRSLTARQRGAVAKRLASQSQCS